MRTMTPRSSNTLKKTIQFHIFIHLKHTFRLYCIEIIWKYKGKSPERNIVKNKNVVFVLELFQHIQSGFRGFWCEIYWIQTWFVLISFNFCKEFNRSLVMLSPKIRVRYNHVLCASSSPWRNNDKIVFLLSSTFFLRWKSVYSNFHIMK